MRLDQSRTGHLQSRRMSDFRGLCGWSGHSDWAVRWVVGGTPDERRGKTWVRRKNRHGASELKVADPNPSIPLPRVPGTMDSIAHESNKWEK